MKYFLFLLVIIFPLASISGQASKQSNSPQNVPVPRNQPAGAFDDRRGKLIVFGGINQEGKSLSDTWEYDGKNWQQILTETTPPARAAHAIAFDDKRNRMILFGGQVGSDALADTWEFDGRDWKKLEPGAQPPARVAHSLVYDSKRRKIILFGGTNFALQKTFNDTWEFDGTNWAEIKTANAPEGRFHHSTAFDAKRNLIVLFGGNAAIPPLDSSKFKAGQRNDTWTFDGKNWTRVSTENAPPKRDHLAIAYDQKARKIILFGGFAGGFVDGIYLGDTWAFDGKNWTELKLPNRPPDRGGKPAMVYDSKRKTIILFGGGTPQKAMNDIWFFQKNIWAESTREKSL